MSGGVERGGTAQPVEVTEGGAVVTEGGESVTSGSILVGGQFVPFSTIVADTPRPKYRYIVEDIMSRRILGELPLNASAFEDALNRPGSQRHTLPVDHPRATTEWLDEGRRAIYVERDGRIEHSGILWAVDRPMGSRTLTLDVGGWLGYWDHRQIWDSRTFTDVEQFTIFKTLVDDAQNDAVLGTGADLSIEVEWDAASGVLRDREYQDYDAKNLGEALRQLAAVDGGFDFSMAYAFNPATDRIDKTIQLHYPTKGRDTGFLFQFSQGQRSNITRWGMARDASEMAWRVRGWGDGLDDERPVSEAIGDSAGVYPFLDADLTQFSGVSDQTTLNGHTVAALARLGHSSRLPMIEIDPALHPRFGDWAVGDTVSLRIDDGYGSPDAPMSVRIVGYKLTASTDRPLLALQEA